MWGHAQTVRFWMHHYRGDIAESQRAAAELLARARQTGNALQQAWALRRTALVQLRTGAAAEAAEHLEQCLRLLPREKDRNEFIATWSALALAHWRNGAEQNAIDAYETVVRTSKQAGGSTAHGMLEALSAMAEVSLSLRAKYPRVSRWRKAAGFCVASLERYTRSFPIGAPASHLWRGVNLELDGDTRRARREWDAGLKAARRLAMQYDEQRLVTKLVGRREGRVV
jgi:tetratricopeptide (TPR) repeat protein